MLVSDISKDMIGNVISVESLVKKVEKKKASNNTTFLNLEFGDKDKEINAKLWGAQKEDIEFFSNNRFIEAQVKVDEYNGRLQLVVNGYSSLEVNDEIKSKLEKRAPESEEGLVEELEGYIQEIEDEAVRKVVEVRYSKNKAKFIEWPAARSMHHNYPSGLLYHTVSMLRLAKNNLNQYKDDLDKDILYGAIILHDMDKVIEYSDAYNPEFTEEGKLLGHIFMSGAKTYAEAVKLKGKDKELDLTKIVYLIHSILAHHGKKEWGSPVTPQTKEAEIIHQIDMMDSRMNMKYD